MSENGTAHSNESDMDNVDNNDHNSEIAAAIDVIDLTVSDQNSVITIATSSDVSSIAPINIADVYHPFTYNAMFNQGTGVFGHIHCKLQLRPSLIHNAGIGVFIREGYSVFNDEVITEYTGFK